MFERIQNHCKNHTFQMKKNDVVILGIPFFQVRLENEEDRHTRASRPWN